jgi:hypothetical protein
VLCSTKKKKDGTSHEKIRHSDLGERSGRDKIPKIHCEERPRTVRALSLGTRHQPLSDPSDRYVWYLHIHTGVGGECVDCHDGFFSSIRRLLISNEVL